jgi:hypothetical protein
MGEANSPSRRTRPRSALSQKPHKKVANSERFLAGAVLMVMSAPADLTQQRPDDVEAALGGLASSLTLACWPVDGGFTTRLRWVAPPGPPIRAAG